MRNPSSPRRVLWLCYGGMLCLAVGVNLTPIYFTTFSETFGGPSGLTTEQLGRISACAFACLVAGIVISGPLSDRWGAKWFVLLGLASTAAGLAVLASANSYAMLLAGAGVMGLGAGALDMVLSPIVSALQTERRASSMNWLHSFYCLGAVGTVMTGSAALYLGIPWRAVAVALMALPLAVFIGFAGSNLPPLVHESATRQRVRHLTRQPHFLAALAAIFLAGASEAGMAQWLPAYAEYGLGYSKAASGAALAGFSIGMVLGRVSAASIERHFDPYSMMIVCCVLSTVLFVAGCFCPYPPVALAACIAVGLTGSCLWPTTLAVNADRFPHGGGSMFALLAAMGNAGCLAMPWVVGIVAELGAMNWGLATATLCPASMAFILWWMKRTVRPAMNDISCSSSGYADDKT
ncbi:MAG: hypothetical protein QG656_2346 [Candidatus Hydrogenedentes bacterium]|nr:hypothetical protein [Candidatus Hydrogenedentota bacterium]